MNSNMILTDILKGSEYSLILFKQDNINSLEERIITKMNKKGGEDAYVTCIVRNKEVKLTPEEVVRQLYAQELIEKYGYPKERIAFEYPIYFGREAKRADIVIRDKDDFNVAYIIVEVKKPKAKDGREQLKSYTHSTGASMAVWTNGTAITYHQRKNPNYFEDIPDIPKDNQTLEDILQRPFTMDDLIKSDKLTQTGKSLKDLVTEMEDEVLANAGVDVFEEVFKLILPNYLMNKLELRIKNTIWNFVIQDKAIFNSKRKLRNYSKRLVRSGKVFSPLTQR